MREGSAEERTESEGSDEGRGPSDIGEEGKQDPGPDLDTESMQVTDELDLGSMLPDYITEACDNARALQKLCEVMGLGAPSVTAIPALMHQFHHDHHDEEPFFWETDYHEP